MAESPRNKNLHLKKKFEPSHWEDFMMEFSNQNPTIDKAESSSKKETTYDFAFIMEPARLLKNALEALSEPNFNPIQEGVIQVGDRGCEIIVWTFNLETGSEAFGYLLLRATGLQAFQCKKPFRKSFSFKEIIRLCNAAEKLKAESVHLYVEEGSNSLSWDFGPTAPESIGLNEVDPAYEVFPDSISYGYEAVVPSSVLEAMSRKLRYQATPRPETVEVYLEPATLELSKGAVYASSMGKKQLVNKISVEWQFWESLERASSTADRVSVYLVTDPYDGLMMRFHLEQLGDLVYLKQADFDSVSRLPFLGNFHKLN